MAFGAGSLGSLIVKIETDLTGLNTGLKTANQKIQQSSGEILKMTSQVGRQMTIAGAAITAAMGGMVKASIDFESAFAGVRKTVDATEAEFQRLEGNFRGLSTEIPITATELARIGEKAGQLGIRGVEDLTKFTETIALIGVTTDLTTEDAAIAFARIANIMKEPIKNIDRMGAAVVDLGNNFAANEVEITRFATRVAGAGQLMKMSTADIFGIGTAFTAVGVEAEMGGTAVQKVILKIVAAVSEGNSDLQVFAKVSGMTVEEFKKMKEEDPSEVFVRFVEGLGKLGDDAIPILEKLGLSNERVRSAFLRMGSASDVLRNAVERSGVAWDENTALLVEAEKRFKTTASQLKLLLNNIVEVGIKIGDTLLPVLKPMIEDFKKWLIHVGEWITAHPQFTAGLAKAVALFGLLLLAIGPILIVLPQIVTSIGLITTALAAMNIALGPIAAVAAAAFAGWQIGKLISDLTGLTDAIEGNNERLQTFHDWMVRIGEAALTFGWSEVFRKPEEEAPVDLGTTVAGGEDTGIAPEEGISGEIPGAPTDEAIDLKLSAMDRFYKGSMGLLDQFLITTGKMESADIKTRTKWYDAYYKSKDDFQQKSFENMKSVLAGAAAESKAAAAALGVIRIGEAIMNTAAGVTFALASYPPPVSYVWAAITAAMGAIEIATIASASFAEGTDSVPANVSPGEIIVPRTFASAIRSGDLALSGPGEGGSGGKIIQELNIIFEGDMQISNEIDIEDLGDALSDRIERNLRTV